jgi:glutamyl-tRNA reductase
MRATGDWDATRGPLRDRLRELVAQRLEAYERGSPLERIRSDVERIRQREIARTLRLHPGLPPETIDLVTRSLVNQILHRPTLRLRDDPGLARSFASLFAEPEPGDEA